jgi:hypothetical protein
VSTELPRVDHVPGQIEGQWAAALIERGKARWDNARTLTVVQDPPALLGPYPRPGAERVSADQVLVHLLSEPGCPSLDECSWLYVGHPAATVVSLEFRVRTREQLELWAGHFALANGREKPLSGGKLECTRWGNLTVGGRVVDIKVSGTLGGEA